MKHNQHQLYFIFLVLWKYRFYYLRLYSFMKVHKMNTAILVDDDFTEKALRFFGIRNI